MSYRLKMDITAIPELNHDKINIAIQSERAITDVSLDEMMNAYEKEILTSIMQKCHNASEAARILKINKSTISRKLAKYQIKAK